MGREQRVLVVGATPRVMQPGPLYHHLCACLVAPLTQRSALEEGKHSMLSTAISSECAQPQLTLQILPILEYSLVVGALQCSFGFFGAGESAKSGTLSLSSSCNPSAHAIPHKSNPAANPVAF